MAPPKRTSFQIDRDRREIADLYLKGHTQAEIAAYINADKNRAYTLSRQMISYDLIALRKLWLKSSLIDIDEMKANELAKIDHLELEYWDAWKRSQDDAEEIKELLVEDIGIIPVERKLKGQAGDPRFLQGVQWCIERRCKILGVDAPSKAEITGKGGGPIETKDVSLTDEQRIARVVALADAARAKRDSTAP